MPTRFKPARPTAVLLLAALLAGCGAKTADVSGTVTYKGKAVTSGSVGFYAGETAAPVVVAIGPDGRYKAPGVPVGPVKATVYSPNPKEEASEIRSHAKDRPDVEAAAGGADPKTWVALPDKYADPTKTDLSYTIKPGANDLNIELK